MFCRAFAMAYRVDALHHGGDLEPACSRFRNKKARQLIAPGTPLAIHSKTNRTKAVICRLRELSQNVADLFLRFSPGRVGSLMPPASPALAAPAARARFSAAH